MIINPLNDNNFIEEIISIQEGEKYLVGGCVRDWLMGEKSKDLDFLFASYPNDLIEKLKKKYNLKYKKFEKFLTMRIFLNGRRIDMSSFRKEIYEKIANLPKVFKAKNIEEDLKRRDFTINSIALSLNKENKFEIIDPFNGIESLKKKEIKILHNKSFLDDPTRIFRAIRFLTRFNFKFEKNTKKVFDFALKKKVYNFLSDERIRNEILKFLEEEKSFPSLSLILKLKILNFNIKLNKNIDKLKDPLLKLAFLCAKAEKPIEFINFLKLEKEKRIFIEKLLTPLILKEAPLKELNKEEKYFYCLLFKNEYNLNEVFISVKDLENLGFDKYKFSFYLKKIASLQWKNKIKNKKEAIIQLKKWRENI